jgi:hypothetical protein
VPHESDWTTALSSCTVMASAISVFSIADQRQHL